LKLTDADYVEIDQLLAQLETKLSGLIGLSTSDRRSLKKMGDKSENFCRQTLLVLARTPAWCRPTCRWRTPGKTWPAWRRCGRNVRLGQLLGRAEDTEMALGSDVMAAALEGYALLKVMGKGSGLEALRQGIGERFSKSPRAAKSPPAVA
jgi:hypothetical protein